MNYDEILAWEWESGTWHDLFLGVFNDTQQFLYYALVKISLYLAPVNNDFWVRVPSLLMGAGATLGIYYYVRRSYSTFTAVFFIASTIVHPLISCVATYNRPYSLLLFLMCWHLVLCQKVLIKEDTKNNWFQWALVVTTIALPFVHYLSLVYLFGVFVGILFSVGFAPLARIYSSIGKISFLIVGACAAAICFVDQYQFRDRIAWAFEAYGYFDVVSMAVGSGGVFLLCFFYRLKLFSLRDATEKFLVYSFAVVLIIMTSSKMWVGQYFIMLTPISLWLSCIYFEKIVVSLRERQFLNKYKLATILAVLIFINSSVFRNLGFETKFTTASHFFFKMVRTGDWIGLKHFFVELKEKNVINNDTRILCVKNQVYLSERPAEYYSKMYWKRDICSRYVTNLEDIGDISSYEYVLIFTLRREEQLLGLHELMGTAGVSLSPVIQASEYEFYKLVSFHAESSM